MLRFNFKAAFAARGITNVYGSLVLAGFSKKAATNIANEKLITIQLRHVEAICRMLNCTPNDLMIFAPSTERPLPDGHQLGRLSLNLLDVSHELKNLSFEELGKVTKQIKLRKQAAAIVG